MTTTITQFTAGADGGTPPSDTFINAAIGGTAAAGDWLQITTVGGSDGAGLDEPVIEDDGPDPLAGWIKDFDHVTGTGGDAFRTIGWRKHALGGEGFVAATWPAPANKVFIGFWAHDLTWPTLYLLSSGEAGWDGSHAIFENTGTILEDGASYVGGAGFARFGLTDAEFQSPPSPSTMGGLGTTLGSAVGCVAHYSTAEGSNTVADVLRYQTAPNQGYYDFWYSFTEGAPDPVEIHGSGALLLDGEIGLESTGGLADVIPAGGLLLDGSIGFETTGGDARISGTGRLLVAGDVFVTAPRPFPQPVRIPENHLGCGVYQVLAMTRGLGEIVTMLPFSQVEWERVLDETSNATLTIDGVANPRALARCCAALSILEPEEHELAIYRNGWRVWSGPITDLSFPAEQCVIQASDLSWWLSARTIHENINSVQVDLVEILLAYIQDAMAVDNSAGLRTRILALAAQLGDRLVQRADHQLAADVIGELARTGVDWTTLDREILLGPLQPQPPPFPGATPYPTLIDANFRVQPTILVSGSQGGNCFYVNGPPNGAGDLIFGEYGPAFPATDDHVAQPAAPDYAEIEEQYGRIERVVTESRILDQPGIDANAKTRYELLKRPLVYISDGALLPSTPIPIDKLLPGSLVNVHLSNVCRVIAEAYRIKSVKVQGNSDGSETVDVQWQPLGTGVVLDGEL